MKSISRGAEGNKTMDKKEVDVDRDVSVVVSHARRRVAEMDAEEWVRRLHAFLEQQPEVKGKPLITGVERSAEGVSPSNVEICS